MQDSWRGQRKSGYKKDQDASQEHTKVTKVCHNPSSSCWDILVWVSGESTGITFPSMAKKHPHIDLCSIIHSPNHIQNSSRRKTSLPPLHPTRRLSSLFFFSFLFYDVEIVLSDGCQCRQSPRTLCASHCRRTGRCCLRWSSVYSSLSLAPVRSFYPMTAG